MSKLFDFENQFILRLPEELASKIHKALSTDPKIPLPNMEITPYISQTDIEGRNLETLRFKSYFPDKNNLLTFF